ncbi:MAG: tryptophan-rich sensory protein [Candidatus Micrarchaeota archaeon]|nr:tryptophan-rich sensory protein [Candidatus Micrarchaeota archaeon]
MKHNTHSEPPLKKAAALVIAILVCQLAGVIGSVFTVPNIEPWYESLAKPWFRPPNWLFFPVWTALYTLMGISLYLVYSSGESAHKAPALQAFVIQIILNVIWSFAFFGLKSPLYGFVVIALLWGAIVLMLVRFYKVSRIAALLQIPYLLWVSFAAVLNYLVLVMN